jgi:hypothetical protein
MGLVLGLSAALSKEMKGTLQCAIPSNGHLTSYIMKRNRCSAMWNLLCLHSLNWYADFALAYVLCSNANTSNNLSVNTGQNEIRRL